MLSKRNLIGGLTATSGVAFCCAALLLLAAPDSSVVSQRSQRKRWAKRIPVAMRSSGSVMKERWAKRIKHVALIDRIHGSPEKTRDFNNVEYSAADERAMHVDEFHGVADRDGDGYLTLEEFSTYNDVPQKYTSLLFNAVDTDGDGRCSLDEWLALWAMGERDRMALYMGIMWQYADQDGDMQLSQGEANILFNAYNELSGLKPPTPTEARVLSLMLDSDKDGIISKSEFERFEDAPDDRPPPEMFDLDTDGYVSARELYTTLTEILSDNSLDVGQAQAFIWVADTDGDNRLSMDEMTAVIDNEFELPQDPSGGFAVFDLNDDGFVTQDEFKQVMAAVPADSAEDAPSDSADDASSGGAEATGESAMLSLFLSADHDGDGMLSTSEYVSDFGVDS